MPWEMGKVPASPVNPVIDTLEVIWVCTSNAGEQLVFDFSQTKNSERGATRADYKGLMNRVRSQLADNLGVSYSSGVEVSLVEALTPHCYIGINRISGPRRPPLPSFHARGATRSSFRDA